DDFTRKTKAFEARHGRRCFHADRLNENETANNLAIPVANMLARVTANMRKEATRLANVEVTLAESRLRSARTNLTEFRVKSQIVDPTADLERRMSLIGQLEGQLVEAKVALSMLIETSMASDSRRVQAEKRISAIANLLDIEGRKISLADTGYAQVATRFEALSLEIEYAQAHYLAARSSLDLAVAQAQRNSRYLAVHVQPTLPDVSEYPNRWRELLVIAAGLVVGWGIITLLVYDGLRRP
ncbi:MAG: hypothetical protein P8L32_02845, partial [Paracoccaceae bacterium]|nr:hypothetical protein [Paracoccaceae bacterium]